MTVKTEEVMEGELKKFEQLGLDIGRLVQRKNEAYGDSFSRSGEVLKVLYPNGIPADGLDDALLVARIIDKLFRIATNKNAFSEDPWQDIVGYSILALEKGLNGKCGLSSGEPTVNESPAPYVVECDMYPWKILFDASK
jgi:hypothetical protein